ncbi:MAG: PAS domain S-box protein, partial [Lentisphaeria bacterium]|nr:PAS domain S-box protein [Lentisphaeria bacterium]
IWVLGILLGGADLRFSGLDELSFQIAPVVVFVPFLAAMLMVYVSDGVLPVQRLIIGTLVVMGIFFYLGDLTRLQMRWVTYSVTGELPLEAFDLLLERSRSMMPAVICGQLAALFIMPVTFSRLRNTGKSLFLCCAGALGIALVIDSFICQVLSGGKFESSSFLAAMGIRIAAGCYLALLLAVYITKLGRESEARKVGALEIFFAFLGSYGRSKLLEANLLEWEGRYRVILENASEMIVVVDRSGVILDFNRAAEKMLSCNKLAGAKFAGFLNENDSEQFSNAMLSAGGGNSSTGQFYVELSRMSKAAPEEIRYLALTVTALSLGNLPAFVVMGRDLTEERCLEAEKQRLNDELAHSQRLEALGQLAGGVAHDFNNNIHAILGHADLIAMKRDLDDKTKRHLGKIIEIAEHSGGLTSQLLGFARKGKYRESDFDLRVLVRRTAELFMPGCTDVEFAVETAAKPLLVRGDQIQLQQVILNLIINPRDALRMVNDRVLQLDLTAFDTPVAELPKEAILPEALKGLKSVILLTIRDNGCGMDETTLNRMFEPFFTTKPVGQGTGMGMAMAYGTIKNHRGSIGVKSVLGKGTEIFIVLPPLTE